MADGGVWRTISGRRVFIKDGQSLTEAMRESGKFRDLKSGNDDGNTKDNSNIKDLSDKISKLEEKYKNAKGKERIETGKELRRLQSELDKMTGADEERRINKLKNHDVTIAQERILKQMGAEDYSLDQLEQAIEYDNALKKYTGGVWYKNIRDKNDQTLATIDLRNKLEEYIEIGDKFKGTTYRGLSFADEKQFNNFMDSVKPGNEIDMGGISSWATEKTVAVDFASQREYKIVLRNENNKNGADISNFSTWKGENEVIYGAKDRFVIKETTEQNGVYYVRVGEVNEDER